MFLKQNELEKLSEEFLWLKQEIFNSESVITKADFPCVFGVQGYKRQLHYVSALNYPYDSKELSNDIEKYLKELDSLDSKESGLSGLLVYFQPLGNMSIKAKQFLSWRVLSEMKNKFGGVNDNIDSDPKQDNYSFKFKDELWFINFSSNSYLHRDSRNLKSFLILALQTFSRSNTYFKANNTIKAKAQKTVRTLAEKFDGCPVHSGLGPIIGSEKFSPVKLSYYIGDTNEEPSFQPWLYEEFSPDKIVIDGNILKNVEMLNEFNQFNQLKKPFELLLLDESENNLYINSLSKSELLKYDAPNILFVSDKQDNLSEYKGGISSCLIGKNNKSSKTNYFHIEHFNDLLALYK